MTKQSEIDKKYSLLEEREKVLIRPSRYVGAIEPTTQDAWLYQDGKMQRKEITWNPAFQKLFDEIISNSTDHSKTPAGSHMTEVRVEYDGEKLSIYDNGGIPIVIHSEHKMYIPEMIFGNMHSGSNFNDELKTTCTGSNGEGSSLVNIFSTEFIVESADGKNEFKQIFTENMSKRTKPDIKKSKRKFTRITWTVDKKYLHGGIQDYQNLEKLIKRVYDAAACNQHLKFYINGKLIKFNKGFQDYVNLFSDNVIYTENENWSVGFAPSLRGDFEHISFVNGTASYQGGTHISYITDQVTEQIRQHVKKKTKQDILPAQIKNHILLFINATIENPRYDSQTKENLVTNVGEYGTSIIIPEAIIKKIIKSEIMESLMRWVEAKAIADENKKVAKEQKKQGKRNVEKHIEAAGDTALEKFIHFTEGDSAIGNFVDSRNVDNHGGYPLRGKVMNIKGRKPIEILANTECADMMSIIGLTIGEDFVESELKYGHVVIMTDADPDGDCITAQLINFFGLWPRLFEQGRILRLRTPMYIVHIKDKDSEWFYNREDYQDWLKTNERPKPKDLEYIKGLGELEEADYYRCINEPVYQVFSMKDLDKTALELAFGDDAEPRKPWLLGK